MDNIELLNKAYILRNAFINDIKKHIFTKKIDTYSIYNIYFDYINELTYDENDYLDIEVPKPFKLRSAKSNALSKFFFWIYNMTSNIHNAFISRFYKNYDMTLFFSGFSLDSDISIAEALSIFENQSPYDIEYVELLSPFDKHDFDIIKGNNIIDLFFLYQLTSYFGKQSFIIYANYLNYFINKKEIRNNYIFNFCLNLFELIVK